MAYCNSQGQTRNALVKRDMRHTFRHKPGDKERRKLFKQLEAKKLNLKPVKQTISVLLSRVGHTRTLGRYPSKLLEIDPLGWLRIRLVNW